jgi:acetaldehyde dehydrogenase (acetylating)
MMTHNICTYKQYNQYFNGEQSMELDLDALHNLITNRTNEIEAIVDGTGYLPRTVIGVATFLLDYDGNLDLLTAKQQVTFEKFIEPLLSNSCC